VSGQTAISPDSEPLVIALGEHRLTCVFCRAAERVVCPVGLSLRDAAAEAAWKQQEGQEP
jgi:hypothetical protein